MSGVGNANLIVLHWDEDGNELTPDEHGRRYPKRKLMWITPGLHCTIKTEFSGINHNADADGKPLIYVNYVMSNGAQLTVNRWTPDALAARKLHESTCRKDEWGVAYWWRFRLWFVSTLTRKVKAVTPRG